MVGRTISHYRIVAQLGAGGMGILYRAEDIRLGRDVALKFLSDELPKDDQAIRRLRSEARAASALNHGNICTIYDIEEADGQPFIVMELMKGRALRDCLAAGSLKIHQLIDIGIEIADALHAAHSQGIIHRDIKPGNIFVTDSGHVKILDFGLAKLTPGLGESGTTPDDPARTVVGVTRGTVSYMSPEQATGEELDTRTDLFSLGVVLYECATGRHPFPGKTSAVILASILHRAPVAPVVLNPELPLRLQEVINTCLEKERELRYQSAADIRADLKRVRRDIESGHSHAINGTDVSPTPPVRGSTPAAGTALAGSGANAASSTARGSTRALWGAAALVIVAAIGAGSYVTSQRRASAREDLSRIAAMSDATIRSRVGLAQASLDDRNYRSALAYAAEVLAVDPHHAGAIRIRDEARAMLVRFDAAMTEAGRRIASGDVEGAARALDVARGIDATSPGVTGIASKIAEKARQREPLVSQSPPRPSAEPSPSLPNRPTRTRVDSQDIGARGVQPARQPGDTPPLVAAGTDAPGPIPTAPAPVPAAAPPAVIPPEPAVLATSAAPSPVPSGAARSEREEAPAAPSPADDEAAIRRLASLYARAIENKDVTLFRSIKPNLSREDERRLQEGFRAVTSQQVNLTILSIDVHGDDATMAVRRHDTINAAGRQHTTEGRQTIALKRTSGGWMIVDIR